MATLTNTNKLRAPKKVTVKILDSTYNVKYSRKFLTWTTLQEIKAYLQKKNGVKPSKQRLFQHQSELLSKNVTVEEMLEDEDTGEQVYLTLRYKDGEKEMQPYVKPFIDSLMAKEWIKILVSAINKGFNMGLVPQAVSFGVSGSYFLRGPQKNNVAIFKPLDEEPYAPNNLKGYVGKFGSKSMREGILSGEGASREVAAYLLDKKRIHRVPETFFAEVYHPMFAENSPSSKTAKADLQNMLKVSEGAIRDGVKYGSVQFMKENDGESCDYSCRKFPTEEIQSIAALDIRILNCDRNEGNILVRKVGKDQFNLIPIDHALSLSDTLSICDYELCWSLWPHIEKPTDEKLHEYICQLDTRANVKMLKKYLRIRPICLRNFRIAETLLIRATQRNMTLFEITKIMYKLDPEGPNSVLEDIVAKAEAIYSIVKTSVSKSLYLQLNDIHQKQSNDKLMQYHGSNEMDLMCPKTPEILSTTQHSPSGSPEARSPGIRDKKMLFHDSSHLNVNHALVKKSSHEPHRKRAQSVFGREDEPEDGLVRLNPLMLQKGISNSGKPRNCVETPHHTVDYTITTPKSHFMKKVINRTATKVQLAEGQMEGNLIRKTISNPDLRKLAQSPLSDDHGKDGKKLETRRNNEQHEYDEMFFYYFENILSQVLDKLQNSKSIKNRDRAQSYFC